LLTGPAVATHLILISVTVGDEAGNVSRFRRSLIALGTTDTSTNLERAL
jgi:hypothetical protein